MDLKQLVAVVTVADLGSISAAARRLHLVQPSVTRQIRTLEQELGVELFTRGPHGMTPTAAGRTIVDRARRALLEVERGRAEVAPVREGVSGLVTVGLLESVAEVLAGPLVDAVAASHPGIRLRLLTAYSGHLHDWLANGALDLSLLYEPDPAAGLAAQPLVQEELWAVAPRGSDLPRDAVRLTDLLAHPLVLPVPGHGLRTVFDRACADAGRLDHIEVAIEVNALSVQKRMVETGRGWSVLPASGVAADVAAGRLGGAPLCEPAVTRRVELAGAPGTRAPAAVTAVARAVTGVVSELVASGVWVGAEHLARRHGDSRAKPSDHAVRPV